VTSTGLVPLATERTTAATDLILALVVVGGILWLWRAAPPGWRRAVWLVALAAFGASALLGAAAHGLALAGRLAGMLWQALYFLLGMAVALFIAGALADWRGEAEARGKLPALLIVAALFYLATRLTGGDFRVFLVFEGTALVFALAVYGALGVRGRAGAGTVAAAMALSLAAGVIQAMSSLSVRLGWEFDHNGLYHIVQMVGVVVLIRGLAIVLR
jgi:hypothetical protein